MSERALDLKRRLRDGATALGAWLSIADPAVAEIMAGAGFDYILIDTEHAPWSLESLQTTLLAFRGMPTVPIVRVPWNDQVHVKQALDVGADGVLAPMVRSAAEARALVAAAKYPPDGIRGFGPRRASDYGRNIDAYVTGANAATIVIPQIEDVGAAEAIDEILAVPGVDALCIGPNDLSGSAGVLRQHDHPVVRGAIDRILKRRLGARRRGLHRRHLAARAAARLDRPRRPARAADLGRRAVGRRRCRAPWPPRAPRWRDDARRRHRRIASAPPTRCCATSSTPTPESGPDAPATAGMLGRLLSNRDVAILIVAVVLFALFALAGPRFLSENNLVDIARRAAILGILAVGMTYLFVAGELDLSIGSHYGFLLDPDVVPGGAARHRSVAGGRRRDPDRAHDRRGQRPAGDPRRPAVVHHHARHAGAAARRGQRRLERLPDPGEEHRSRVLPDHPRQLPGHADPQPVRRDGWWSC